MTLYYPDFAYTRSVNCFEEQIMAKTKIVLDEEERRELNRRLRARTVSVRDRQRAQIILLMADG